MRYSSIVVAAALGFVPMVAAAQLKAPAARTVAPGDRIRVTWAADTGQAIIRGTYQGEHGRQLVVESDDGQRRPRGVVRQRITQIEVGRRGQVGGAVGGILGLVGGIAIAKGMSGGGSSAGCAGVCVDLDGGTMIAQALIPLIGLGLGYVVGHQFDPVRWEPAVLGGDGR